MFGILKPIINFMLGEHLKFNIAPVLAAAGISAGAGLVSGLISAKQRRKDRKSAAKIAEASEISKTGQQKQKALSGIIDNFRSALIR